MKFIKIYSGIYCIKKNKNSREPKNKIWEKKKKDYGSDLFSSRVRVAEVDWIPGVDKNPTDDKNTHTL